MRRFFMSRTQSEEAGAAARGVGNSNSGNNSSGDEDDAEDRTAMTARRRSVRDQPQPQPQPAAAAAANFRGFSAGQQSASADGRDPTTMNRSVYVDQFFFFADGDCATNRARYGTAQKYTP